MQTLWNNAVENYLTDTGCKSIELKEIDHIRTFEDLRAGVNGRKIEFKRDREKGSEFREVMQPIFRFLCQFLVVASDAASLVRDLVQF